MKVYVVEYGCYSDRSVTDVFSTLQSAQDSCLTARRRPYRWRELTAGVWINNSRDMDTTVNITEFELMTEARPK